jgi:hypothetical protein
MVVTAEHEITPDGESTEKWYFRSSGFFESVEQLTRCARCGSALCKRSDEPTHVFHITKPTMHFICDDCFDALP